jgi:hypothetical protein
MRADVRPKRLGGAVEFVHAAVQIVDHEPHVSIHVPIQPGLVDVLRPTRPPTAKTGCWERCPSRRRCRGCIFRLSPMMVQLPSAYQPRNEPTAGRTGARCVPVIIVSSPSPIRRRPNPCLAGSASGTLAPVRPGFSLPRATDRNRRRR